MAPSPKFSLGMSGFAAYTFLMAAAGFEFLEL